MNRRVSILSTTGMGIAIALVGVTGTAYAYYQTSITGTTAVNGVGTAGTPSAVTIAAGTASAQLQPGGTGDLMLSVTNSNSYSVGITDLAITSVTAPGCTNPSITLVPSKTYLPKTIPANASATPLTVIGALQMGTDATNDCQGKTFTITLTPTVRR